MSVKVNNFQQSNPSENNHFKWNSFYRALVLDAHDERQLGRVKVRIPDLMPEDGANDCGPWDEMGLWAHPANNYLGGRNFEDTMGIRADFDDAWYQGSCLIPPKGSWVWVFFECGDPNHPFYFGAGDFGQRKVLPENQNGAEWEKKWTLIKTREGRCIVISDDADDCRVEITGKKRLITKEPDGDIESIFPIDDNQTVILLDEREGKENLLMKDYRGNFIRMHIDNNGIKDQLHVFFKDDIHIETLKNMLIKTGENMEIRVGQQYHRYVAVQTDTYCVGPHHETALRFDRYATLVDSTHAGLTIFEKSGMDNITVAGGIVMERSAGSNYRCTNKDINDQAKKNVYIGAGDDINLSAGGTIWINGVFTKVQMGSIPPECPLPKFIAPILAIIAAEALPIGDRDQEPTPQLIPDPVIAVGITLPPPTFITTEKPDQEVTEPFGNPPVRPRKGAIPVPAPLSADSPIVQESGGGGGGDEEQEEEQKKTGHLEGGLGHIYMLLLKDEYRDKVIPLIDKSYGKYVSFSIFKDPVSENTEMEYNMDAQFMDPESVPVFRQYRATPGQEYNWNIDDTTKWWRNLDEVCEQARYYGKVIVPTIFDFYDSPHSPFITEFDAKPYSEDAWHPMLYGSMLKKLMYHIHESEVEYILNIGYRAYVQSNKVEDIYPDSGFLKNLISYLVNECGVSVSNIALTANDTANLYTKAPLSRYKSYFGNIAVGEDEINIEEYVDGQWGGTGRVSVFDSHADLIDGYTFFLQNCLRGLPVMSHWKMKAFLNEVPVDDPTYKPENIMNYIFAPRQREAMRLVYGHDNKSNGFIDFSGDDD